MDFQGPEHIYWVAPPTNGNPQTATIEKMREILADLKEKKSVILLSNPKELKEATEAIEKFEKQLEETEKNQVLIGLSCVTVPDQDGEAIAQSVITATEVQSKWQTAMKDRTYKLIASKYKGVKNLTIKGQAVKDFDDFYHNGPPEMVAWVCKAVMSSEMLTAYERKN